MTRLFPVLFRACLFFAVLGSPLRSQTVISGPYSGATFTGANIINPNTSATFSGSNNATGATITFGTNTYFYLNNTNASLTFNSASTATGVVRVIADSSTGTVLNNQGTITHTSGNGDLYARTFTNSGTITASAGNLAVGNTNAIFTATNTGTITATGAGTIVEIAGNVANTGTGILRAQSGGILRFTGTNTSANLGNVDITGGSGQFNGTLNNTLLNAPTGGRYSLLGGTIVGGTIAGNALSLTSSSGTLNGVTFTGNLNLPASTNAGIAGATSFNGGSATFASSTYLYLNNTNASLTFDGTSTATGVVRVIADSSTGTVLNNQGTITHTSGNGDLYARTFTNSGTITASAGNLAVGSTNAIFTASNTGTITATGAGTIVEIAGNVANTGTGILRAQSGGILRFTGTNTSANLGNVDITGGSAQFNGTLNNTLLNPPTGGRYSLLGGTIVGGTIAGNALSLTSSSGTLNGVTFTGNLNLPASTNSGLAGSSSFNGGSATFASSTYLYLNNTNASLTFDATSSATGVVRVIADGSTGTVLNNQGTITHSSGSGDLFARTFTNSGPVTATGGTLDIGTTSAGYSTSNSSTITSNGSGTLVRINGNFANTGTLVSLNSGQFLFGGTNTTGPLGTVQLSPGGRALLNGTLSNAAANLTAPTGGVFELYGGTITGGTFPSTVLTFTNSGGTLNGSTLTGDFSTPANTHVYFAGGTTFSGATLTLGANSGIYWQQVGTLSGKAITQANGSYLYVSSTNSALTIDTTSSVTGDVSLYSDGSLGTAITNQGTLTHNLGSGSLYARTFTNTGSILATASTLDIGSTSSGYNSFNSGTITATGSGTTIHLSGNFTNSGTLIAQNSGQLVFNGPNTSGNLGTVQLSTGGRALLNGTLSNSAANLTAPTGGVFELYGGTINGGTIANGALSYTNSGGTLSGVTLTGDFSTPANSHVYFANGTTFTGALATLAANSGIYWQQVGTLSGKTITQGNGSYLYVNGTNNALTIAANSSVTGDVSLYSDGSTGTAITNQGTLTHNLGSGDLYARTFTNAGSILATASTLDIGSNTTGYNSFNSGTITATGSGTTINLRGNFTNTGTLIAQNSGQLLFSGANTSGNLGTVQLSSGGRALLNGTLSNSAANLTAPSGGMFELYGGTINGGTVANGALSFTNSGGTLSAVTLTGDFTMPANSHVYFANGTTFTGALATIASNAGIYWQQVGTLSGKSITLGNGAYLYATGTNNALTIDPTSSVTGDVSLYSDGSAGTAITNQGTLTHNLGNGDLYARTFTNTGSILATASTLDIGSTSTGYNSFNSGTITSTGSGTTIRLSGNFTNTGTLTAQNSGQLLFNGANTTGNLGTVQLSTGGRALLNGTLSNAAANLIAPTGGAYELYGGTINGGTIASGALSFTNSGGTLSGVTLSGNFSMPASSHVYFTNGTSFTGTTATIGAGAGIYWQQNATLNGKALTLGNGSYVYVSGANSALTIDSASSVTGYLGLYTDGSLGTSITNQGTLTHNLGAADIYARSFVNSGSITATVGTLSIGSNSTGYSFVNNPGATITVAGASVFLNAPTGNPILNAGTINVQSGTLYTGNDLVNGGTGTITGGGTINGGLTISGGILAPGNSIGNLTVVGGAFLINGSTTFAAELNATTADQLVFQSPSATVNLGSGLLNLSLTLLSAPTANMTYNLIRISSGGSGITGTFAGLPSSGDGFTASFGATPYHFTVNYATNLISITAVPEPSTYALFGFGLLGMGWWQYRRRRR